MLYCKAVMNVDAKKMHQPLVWGWKCESEWLIRQYRQQKFFQFLGYHFPNWFHSLLFRLFTAHKNVSQGSSGFITYHSTVRRIICFSFSFKHCTFLLAHVMWKKNPVTQCFASAAGRCLAKPRTQKKTAVKRPRQRSCCQGIREVAVVAEGGLSNTLSKPGSP